VSRFQQWLIAVIWAAAVAGTIFLISDYRWFSVTFTAVVLGLVAATVWKGVADRRRWAAVSLGALASAMGLFTAYPSANAACTAIDASGKRVVIGTEFTAEGAQYKAQHPLENNSDILEALGGRGPELAWTPASIQRCRQRLLVTGVLWVPLFGVAGICAAGFLGPAGREKSAAGRKKIFISYSHDDAAVARKLSDHLKRNKLEVIIDLDSMAAGQRIEEFIEQSIREAETVVSIVSASSLLSAWVAMETINCFNRQDSNEHKLFIGCYLSEDFFRPEFRLECTRQIDERLEVIEKLLPVYAEQKIDPLDLNHEKSRLYELRNNLGQILAVLKESLCVDLRDGKFEENMRGLIASIRGKSERSSTH